MMSTLLQNQNFGSQTQLSCTDKAEDFVRIMTDQYNPAKKYITPFCNSFVCIYIYIYSFVRGPYFYNRQILCDMFHFEFSLTAQIFAEAATGNAL